MIKSPEPEKTKIGIPGREFYVWLGTERCSACGVDMEICLCCEADGWRGPSFCKRCLQRVTELME